MKSAMEMFKKYGAYYCENDESEIIQAMEEYAAQFKPTAEANANTVLGEARHYLKKAYSELRIIASYADDPRTQIGMMITARACKDLCDKIKDAGFA